MAERKLTIVTAAESVLKESGKPMTAAEIHAAVVKKNLFTFGAKDPVAMVRTALRKELRKEEGGRSSRVRQVDRERFAV
jgi:HB1, ASXL, restriction endonuclease HTH domain